MSTAAATGKFYDGQTGTPQDVTIALTGSSLRLTSADGSFEKTWSFNEIRVLDKPEPPMPAVLSSTREPEARLHIQPDEGWARIRDQLPRHAFAAISLSASWTALMGYGLLSVVILFLLFFSWPKILEMSAYLIPHSAEDRLGRYVLKTVIDDPVCVAPDGLEALDKITARLEDVTSRGINYKIYVIDQEEILNALAAPGGYLMLFRDVITKAETPEEIAGVLAHEMAHIELYHTTRGLMRDTGLSLSLQMVFGTDSIAEVAGFMSQLSYSRDDEREADQFGQEMLISADIDPGSMVLFFERLQQEKQTGEEEVDIDSKYFQYFSTHPPMEKRISRLQKTEAAPKNPRKILNRREWAALKNICDETENLE